MEYRLINANKSTYEIIVHGWFLGVFQEMLVQSLLLFFQRYSCSQVLGFQLNECIPASKSQK